MHNIEPFFNWLELYSSADDQLSPFYRREYNEFEFSNKIYNYYIHPQWDDFGSSTLYLKVLFSDYDNGFTVIEMIGEWNDCIGNDIMYFKRNVIDPLIKNRINKFVIIGENVLNFHASDDCYYEEWYDDIKDQDGWIIGMNLRDHVIEEMEEANLAYYLKLGKEINCENWRTYKPLAFCKIIDEAISRRLLTQ